jgi:hypothetical protein
LAAASASASASLFSDEFQAKPGRLFPAGELRYIRPHMGCRCNTRSMVMLAALLGSGCVSRTLTVHTNPPGALVWLNDQEAGRTPMSVPFLWYGNYDVVIRADGYRTLKTSAEVNPPLWEIIPLDLITDLLPLHHEQVLNYKLQPLVAAQPDFVLARGEELQSQLIASSTTKPTRTFETMKARKPTTRPTTRPSL